MHLFDVEYLTILFHGAVLTFFVKEASICRCHMPLPCTGGKKEPNHRVFQSWRGGDHHQAHPQAPPIFLGAFLGVYLKVVWMGAPREYERVQVPGNRPKPHLILIKIHTIKTREVAEAIKWVWVCVCVFGPTEPKYDEVVSSSFQGAFREEAFGSSMLAFRDDPWRYLTYLPFLRYNYLFHPSNIFFLWIITLMWLQRPETNIILEG